MKNRQPVYCQIRGEVRVLDGVYVGALLNGSRFSQSRIRQTDQDGRTTVSVAQIDAFEQLAATDAEKDA